MTVDEAVGIVKAKAAGRTRWEGQQDFLDEVLVAEIERLRSLLPPPVDSSKACLGCQRQEEHKLCPAYGTVFYMSGVPFTPEIEALFPPMNQRPSVKPYATAGIGMP